MSGMKFWYIFLAFLIGAVIATFSTNHYKSAQVDRYKLEADLANSRLKKLCEGPDMGGFRMTTMKCRSKQEFCLCGTPEVLQQNDLR